MLLWPVLGFFLFILGGLLVVRPAIFPGADPYLRLAGAGFIVVGLMAIVFLR